MKQREGLKVTHAIVIAIGILLIITLLVWNDSFAAEQSSDSIVAEDISPVRESQTLRLSFPSVFQMLSDKVDGDYVYISYEDLINTPSLFCSAKGMALPGYASTIVSSGGRSTDTTDGGTPTGMLTQVDVNHATVFQNDASWTTSTSNPYSSTTSKTYGRFRVDSVHNATPAEAWVLSETTSNDPNANAITYTITDQEYTGEVNDQNKYKGQGNTELWAVEWDSDSLEPTRYVARQGDKYYYVNADSYAPYTYVQHAWWKVKTVGTQNKAGVKDTDLAYEAEAFEDYMERIAVTNNGQWQFNEDNTVKVDYTNYVSSDGTRKQLSSDASKADVRFDASTNKYIVGPFELNYLRAGTKQGSREKVSFAGISNVTLVASNVAGEALYDENGESILQLGKNYRFIYNHNHEDYIPNVEGRGNDKQKLDTVEDYPYPYDGEEFYLEIDYLDEMTSLMTLDFDFQYMNAGGRYEYLKGDYLILTWTPWYNYIPSDGGAQTDGSSVSRVEQNINIAMDVSSREGEAANTAAGPYNYDIGREIEHEHIHEGETNNITFEGDEDSEEPIVTIHCNPDDILNTKYDENKNTRYTGDMDGQTTAHWTEYDYNLAGTCLVEIIPNNGDRLRMINQPLDEIKYIKDNTVPMEELRINIWPMMNLTVTDREKALDEPNSRAIGDPRTTAVEDIESFFGEPVYSTTIRFTNKIAKGIKLKGVNDIAADIATNIIRYKKAGRVSDLIMDLEAHLKEDGIIKKGKIEWNITNGGSVSSTEGIETVLTTSPSDEDFKFTMFVVSDIDDIIVQEFSFLVHFPTMYIDTEGNKTGSAVYTNDFSEQTYNVYNIYGSLTCTSHTNIFLDESGEVADIIPEVIDGKPNPDFNPADTVNDKLLVEPNFQNGSIVSDGKMGYKVFPDAVPENIPSYNSTYDFTWVDDTGTEITITVQCELTNTDYEEYMFEETIQEQLHLSGYDVSADQINAWLREAEEKEYELSDELERSLYSMLDDQEAAQQVKIEGWINKIERDIQNIKIDGETTSLEIRKIINSLSQDRDFGDDFARGEEYSKYREELASLYRNRKAAEDAVEDYRNGIITEEQITQQFKNLGYFYGDLSEEISEIKKEKGYLKDSNEYFSDIGEEELSDWEAQELSSYVDEAEAAGYDDYSNPVYQTAVKYNNIIKNNASNVKPSDKVSTVIENQDTQKADLEKQQSDIQGSINDVNSQIENSRNNINNIIQEIINQLRQQIEQSNNELNNINSELSGNIDADRRTELERRRDELLANIDNCNKTISDLEMMININNQMIDAEQQQNVLEDELEALQNEQFGLIDEQAKLKGNEKTQNKNRVNELTEVINEKNKQINELEKNKASLREDRQQLLDKVANSGVVETERLQSLQSAYAELQIQEMNRDRYIDQSNDIESSLFAINWSSSSSVSLANRGTVFSGLQDYDEGNFQYYLRLTNATTAPAQDQSHPIDIVVKNIDAQNGRGEDVAGDGVHLQIIPDPIELTTSISGSVWIDQDEDPKDPSTGTLGVYDSNEQPAAKNSVEIIVWKVTYDKNGNEIEREKAIGWDTEKNPIDFIDNKLYIDENGNYTIPEIQIPSKEGLDTSKYSVAYDVEFIYDGQTYEATEYFKSANKDSISDKLEEFKLTAAETKGEAKDYTRFEKDSYIVENADERKAFDAYFTEVYGKDDINTENGNTTGQSTGGIGGVYYSEEERSNDVSPTTLDYTSTEVGEGDNAKRQSDLVTTNSEGFVLDQYRFAARTSTAGLVLPYEEQYHVKKEYYDNLDLVFLKMEFKPVDEYFDHINLGLLERYETDVSLLKDLYSAKVVVNEQQTNYTFNSLGTLTGEALSQQIDPSYRQMTYKLDLYNSDYYYRSSVYESVTDTITKEVLNAIKDETELRLFVTYRIAMYNESELTDVSINEFKDYYDKTFTLITQETKASIVDNQGNRSDQTVAYAPYYRKLKAGSAASENYFWNKDEDLAIANIDERVSNNSSKVTGDLTFSNIDSGNENYKGSVSTSLRAVNSDGTINNDMTLEPGEYFEVFVTYEVDYEGWEKATQEAAGTSNERPDLLGLKTNIAEITNYSSAYTTESVARHKTTSYQPEQISGKVDRDSAADNINMNNLDKAKFFEDDTEYAPTLEIKLKEGTNRTLSGIVWEDSRNDNENGNGIYDEGESGIGGVDVTLVEKIKINPGDLESGAVQGLQNLELLDYEFEYVWPDGAFGDKVDFTARTKSSTDDSNKGQYTFSNFATGMYVVRFEYGNNDDTLKYNGQDYKNTSYQTGMTNTTEEIGTSNKPGQSTLNNEWHDLSNNDNAKALEQTRVSDARDYEPRRMQVMAYSRTITNENAEVLAAYVNDASSEKVTEEYRRLLEENKEELIENTAMVANTAKFNVEIEKQDSIAYKTVETTEGDNNGSTKHEYNIMNVDFGLVKRPETRINIKKEISRLMLLKNDGQEIVLSVECDENGDIIKTDGESSNVNKITEIKKDVLGDGQGFKYVGIESSYLQGLTLSITYRIVVTNNSETDYVGAALAEVKNMNKLYEFAANYESTDKNENNLVSFNTGEGIVYGKYLGLNYYTGTVAQGDTSATYGFNYSNDVSQDTIVKTTIDQLVDYVDNDISINKDATTNIENQSWVDSTEEDREFKFSDASYKENEHSDENFVDDKDRAYIGENKNNIVLTTSENMERTTITYRRTEVNENKEPVMTQNENGEIIPNMITVEYEAYTTAGNEDSHQISAYNPKLTVELEPGQSTEDTYITLSVQANEDSMNNMNYNNLAEVVMYSNTAGRRDMEAIPGNANMIAKEQVAHMAGSNWVHPVELSDTDENGAEIETSVYTERDAYAARDTVTFSEPTGLSLERENINRIVRIILIALIVAAVAVIAVTVVIVVRKTKYDDKDLLNVNGKN